MRDLFNLVVDLDERFSLSPESTRALADCVPGVDIVAQAHAEDATLAWIDEEFGGAWSSEAHAGTNALAFRDRSPVGFATFDQQGLRFRWLSGLARERDVGVFGPFGVAPAERGSGLGHVLLRLALSGLRERGYARALIPAVGDDRLSRYYADAVGARVAERFGAQALAAPRARVVVMASGNGSNLQAVLDAVRTGDLPIDVVGVVSNNPRAVALERARMSGVESVLAMPWNRKEEARADYDARLLAAASALRPDLVLLLGWMHLLDERFVRSFPNLLNLHPAFLPLDPERDDVGMPDGSRIPAFRGAYAVRDALAAGSSWTGATVHAVTPATDRGPVLVRKPLRVEAGEDQSRLMERLHLVEHTLVRAGIQRWLYERAVNGDPS
ncbi:MAG: GNAT family N-acetyltransferase [Candidatus Tumulicola sp.]